ncbi:hypothetical protein AA313_de0200550 [Arthrobotrys entomopaga]|nr:hypothetical protein AA313_de0200550 [Arthrobotrys entomopaga]
MDSSGEPFPHPQSESSNFSSPTSSRRSSRVHHSEYLYTHEERIQRSYRTTEPPAPTSLSFPEQKPYLEVLLNVCIKAAHSFYTTYHLNKALDKKSIPIFLTKDKQVARLPFDLTLPQWTQHLRKACDTRHVTEDMVYSLESFKGEIQPVDEVRHALMKEKVKSDRALLALIEAARTFVKQLKDWERCEIIDGIYEEIEMVIRIKKAGLKDDPNDSFENVNTESILSNHPRRYTS